MRAVAYQRRKGTDFARLLNGKAARQAACDKRTEISPTLECAKANVPKKPREPQRSAERLTPERPAEKIGQLKQTIAKGEYKVDEKEVAKSILRTEISRYLKKSKVQSMSVDLTELLALTEEEIAARGKIAAQLGGPKEARRGVLYRHALNKWMQNRA